MNRKAVRLHIAGKGNSRIPLWCHWYAKETEEKYGTDLDQIKEQYPDDIIMAEFLPARKKYTEHPYWYGGSDEFGCRWIKYPDSIGGQIKEHPLENLDEIDEFLITMEKELYAAERNRFEHGSSLRETYPDKYIVGKLFRLFFERLHFWRGMNDLFIELYTDFPRIKKLMGFLLDFIIYMIDGWKEAGVDAVFLGDDWGFQDQMMINPEFWKENFKPWYTRIFTHARSRDLQTWYHSCGNIAAIIPDLIEAGVQVLNPLQAHAMDAKEIGPAFRGKLSFHGGFDTQKVLSHGSEQEIYAHASELASNLATQTGGYIGGPDATIMPEVPLENIEFLCRAFHNIS